MNGATSKSFMKNLSGSDFTSHRNKKRFFEAADVNKAVGMQKGKHLFTTQHHLSPSPAVDQVTPAHQNGHDKIAYDQVDALSESLGTKREHVGETLRKWGEFVEGGTSKPESTFKTNMKDYPLNTRARALEYERRGWAPDDTTKLPDGSVAHSNGRGVQTDIYSMQQGKNTPRPINNLTAEQNTARTNVIMNSRVRSDGTSGNKPVIKPGSGHGGGRVLTESNDNLSDWQNFLARQEGTALEGSSNSEEDDTKDKKEKVNLNIQPGKATIVAMQRGRHKY